MKDELLLALKEFYQSYIVDTFNGAFQVFRSFTYGEMVIALMLFLILMVILLKWLYEVIR